MGSIQTTEYKGKGGEEGKSDDTYTKEKREERTSTRNEGGSTFTIEDRKWITEHNGTINDGLPKTSLDLRREQERKAILNMPTMPTLPDSVQASMQKIIDEKAKQKTIIGTNPSLGMVAIRDGNGRIYWEKASAEIITKQTEKIKEEAKTEGLGKPVKEILIQPKSKTDNIISLNPAQQASFNKASIIIPGNIKTPVIPASPNPTIQIADEKAKTKVNKTALMGFSLPAISAPTGISIPGGGIVGGLTDIPRQIAQKDTKELIPGDIISKEKPGSPLILGGGIMGGLSNIPSLKDSPVNSKDAIVTSFDLRKAREEMGIHEASLRDTTVEWLPNLSNIKSKITFIPNANLPMAELAAIDNKKTEARLNLALVPTTNAILRQKDEVLDSLSKQQEINFGKSSKEFDQQWDIASINLIKDELANFENTYKENWDSASVEAITNALAGYDEMAKDSDLNISRTEYRDLVWNDLEKQKQEAMSESGINAAKEEFRKDLWADLEKQKEGSTMAWKAEVGIAMKDNLADFSANYGSWAKNEAKNQILSGKLEDLWVKYDGVAPPMEEFMSWYKEQNGAPDFNYREAQATSHAEVAKIKRDELDYFQNAEKAYEDIWGDKTSWQAAGGRKTAAESFAPLRALEPTVDISDITKKEWILGGVQVALITIPI